MKEITITPLGTVSPYPKSNTNCPSFLVEYNNHKILLDCGNGITRLLNLPEYLKDLTIIITHYHKDHFGDIGSLEYASFVYHSLGLLDKRIKIYLPRNDYGNNKSSIIGNNESYSEYIDIDNGTIINIDDLNITFYDNKSHTIESFMVKLENKYFKIVYTSDIGITNFEELINFCSNSDLLICESSFLEKHNSTSKTHMTALNAGLLAKKSKAKKLLLTHFWPEEDKNLYVKEAASIFPNTEAAEETKKLVLRR